MLDELLNLLGETGSLAETTTQKVPEKKLKRYLLILRVKTQVTTPNGKPYWVFILKGTSRSRRIYTEDRDWLLNQFPFMEVGEVLSKIRIKDIVDDGRASCWLRDKLAGLLD